MAFTVLRVPEVRLTVENEMTKRERRAYDAAVEALEGLLVKKAGLIDAVGLQNYLTEQMGGHDAH